MTNDTKTCMFCARMNIFNCFEVRVVKLSPLERSVFAGEKKLLGEKTERRKEGEKECDKWSEYEREQINTRAC